MSITLDEWTSTATKRYLAINIHLENRFWHLGLYRLHGSCPAKTMLPMLGSIRNERSFDLNTRTVVHALPGNIKSTSNYEVIKEDRSYNARPSDRRPSSAEETSEGYAARHPTTPKNRSKEFIFYSVYAFTSVHQGTLHAYRVRHIRATGNMEKIFVYIRPKDGGFISPFLLAKFIEQNLGPIESLTKLNHEQINKLNGAEISGITIEVIANDKMNTSEELCSVVSLLACKRIL